MLLRSASPTRFLSRGQACTDRLAVGDPALRGPGGRVVEDLRRDHRAPPPQARRPTAGGRLNKGLMHPDPQPLSLLTPQPRLQGRPGCHPALLRIWDQVREEVNPTPIGRLLDTRTDSRAQCPGQRVGVVRRGQDLSSWGTWGPWEPRTLAESWSPGAPTVTLVPPTFPWAPSLLWKVPPRPHISGQRLFSTFIKN